MGFVESISELIHHIEEPPVAKKRERKLRVIGEQEGRAIYDHQHAERVKQENIQVSKSSTDVEEPPRPEPNSFDIP